VRASIATDTAVALTPADQSLNGYGLTLLQAACYKLILDSTITNIRLSLFASIALESFGFSRKSASQTATDKPSSGWR
jgi:hypothetical protein